MFCYFSNLFVPRRQDEMANFSDSCYSFPTGSLSSIPGILPRKHLCHSVVIMNWHIIYIVFGI